MSKHTQGPWIIRRFGNSHRGAAYVMDSIPDDNNGRVVANTIATPNTNPSWEANACLIAAAPDLLAACNRLMEACPFVCDVDSCECGENGNGIDDAGNVCEHIEAQRAIAKAQP